MAQMTAKLHKALLLAASSQVALDDFHQGLIRAAEKVTKAKRGGRPPRNDEDPWDEDAVPKDAIAELERRQGAHEQLMERLAADPDLRAEMECWLVDFHGDEEPPGTAAGNIETMTPEQLERATHADFGILPRLVRDWATHHGFTVTDSESGAHGWLLGIPCSDADSVRLCTLAHRELAPHLGAGTLAVQIHFWGWKFKALAAVDDARKFLHTQSVS
jgi:hypothetical protein